MQLWGLATVTRGTASSPSIVILGPLTTASRRSIPWTRVELNTFNQILDETPTVDTVTADTALQRDADHVFCFVSLVKSTPAKRWSQSYSFGSRPAEGAASLSEAMAEVSPH